MSGAPANTTAPYSSSGHKFVTIDELQKMEKRLMAFIETMIQPNLRTTSATPIEANNSWKEDEPSPFSVNILSDQMPPNFKEPLLDNYTGRTDPFYHIAQLESAVFLKNLTGPQKCRLLYTTLRETALQWFSNLPVGSITTYTDFKKQLLARFAFAKKRLRGAETLFDVIQGPTESLQSYVDRFLQATMDIRNFEPYSAQVALTHGLRDVTFRCLLHIIPPITFDKMLEMLNVYIDKWANNNSMLAADIFAILQTEGKHHQHCEDSREGSGSCQAYTVFVKGFDKSLTLAEIQRKLEGYFSSCGKITSVSLPNRLGLSKGYGFLEFEDYSAFSRALRLNGSVFGGCVLTVEEENPRRPNPKRLRGVDGGKKMTAEDDDDDDDYY